MWKQVLYKLWIYANAQPSWKNINKPCGENLKWSKADEKKQSLHTHEMLKIILACVNKEYIENELFLSNEEQKIEELCPLLIRTFCDVEFKMWIKISGHFP